VAAAGDQGKAARSGADSASDSAGLRQEGDPTFHTGGNQMDLTTRYLGLTLRNPFVPSASPLSRDLDTARRLEDSGASALIMYSLFEEVVSTETLPEQASREGGVPGTRGDFPGELDRYLEQVAALKATLEIPVIASLNGITLGSWIERAREIGEAGADAIELNAYYVAADMDENSADVERRYLDLLHELRQHIDLPVNMKLSPFFSSLAHMARKLDEAGADGISLFNRFYQPDIDIDTLRLAPVLYHSESHEALLEMRWIAILFGRTEMSLGATGGILAPEDVVKLLLAGADVVHLCSALLRHGPEHLTVLIDGLIAWMEQQEFEDLDLVRGRVSQMAVADPAGFERTQYVNVLDTHSHRGSRRT
jgi:dihydroorotate dehydrogenase (fumarate)